MAKQFWITALGTCVGILLAGLISGVLAVVLVVVVGVTVPTASTSEPGTFDMRADPTYRAR